MKKLTRSEWNRKKELYKQEKARKYKLSWDRTARCWVKEYINE